MRLLLSLMLVICATFAYADDPDISDGMKDKGTHGVVNTFSGWLEFPQQIRKGYARGIELDPDRPALGPAAQVPFWACFAGHPTRLAGPRWASTSSSGFGVQAIPTTTKWGFPSTMSMAMNGANPPKSNRTRCRAIGAARQSAVR